MKKRFMAALLGILSVFALASCGNNSENPSGGGGKPSESSETEFKPGENMAIINSKSYIFKDSVDFETSYNFHVYKAKDYGDVPYINIDDLKDIMREYADVNVSISKDNHTITAAKTDNKESFVKFDAKNNEISFKNIGSLPVNSRDNSIGNDYCLTAGHVIKSSGVKVGTVGKDSGVISLEKYGMKIYEEDGKFFAPYDLVNVVVQPSSLVPFVYNGKDFFKNPSKLDRPDINSFCYSSIRGFDYSFIEASGHEARTTYKKVDTKSGQKYTYHLVDCDGNEPEMKKEFALFPDGTGKVLDYGTTGNEFVSFDGKITRIKYKEDKDYLTLYVGETEKENTNYMPDENNFTHKLVINLTDTRYAKFERSKQLADFTYNLMCLTFDNIYSVKEAKKFSSFDKFITDNSLKENLKSTNIKAYEDAMVKVLNTIIDDGHTSVDSLSSFGYNSSSQKVILTTKYPQTHTKSIVDKSFNYSSERFNQHNFNSDGILIPTNKDTAYLSFDMFTLGYGVPANFKSYSASDDIEELRKNDTCGYMAACIKKIEEYNKESKNVVKIKNIVVDITANTGGVMPVLPYVACIMTKDPKLCVGDSRTGQVIEYHYYADFDGDGEYGDTYADKFNFFLLTSDASFSCGSSLPSMLKGTNVKIIGMTGAGGASPVTSFTDASGFVYTSSGQFGIYYKDGDSYKTIENGVPVDYEIDKALWYDYENLTKKIDELVKTN